MISVSRFFQRFGIRVTATFYFILMGKIFCNTLDINNNFLLQFNSNR